MKLFFIKCIAGFEILFAFCCVICQFFIMLRFFKEYISTNPYGRFFTLIITYFIICFFQIALIITMFFIKKTLRFLRGDIVK